MQAEILKIILGNEAKFTETEQGAHSGSQHAETRKDRYGVREMFIRNNSSKNEIHNS